jgi:hypothetical protein
MKKNRKIIDIIRACDLQVIAYAKVRTQEVFRYNY